MKRAAGSNACTLAPLGITAFLLAGAALAQSDTSSWVGRPDDPGAPVERKRGTGKAPAPPKSIKTLPSAGGKTAPAQTAPPEKGSTHAKTTTVPPGDDAAYEAFDQGQYLTALELGVKAAERGEPAAHTLVGRIYADGLGTSKNLPLAARWYARGAELGDPEAMFAYGLMLAEGEGVEKDRVEAARFLEAAAAKRHALANYNLALLFLKGDGKPENPYRAFMHMRYAAEQGVTTAQYDLGTMYATGQGTDPNAFEAAKWIGKAAQKGHVEAQIDYAVILFRGHGVPPDPKMGAYFFHQAAEKGAATAQNRLARCYAHGAGVDKNLIEAAKWNFIAKAGGIEDPALEKLLSSMSRGDRAKAQAAAAQWQDRLLIGIE
jgi:TPR repeat protein